MDIGSKLKQAARKSGLSNAEVARRIGISPERYGNYTRNHRQPDYEMLTRICEILGTTPNDLLGYTSTLPSMENDAFLFDVIRTVLKTFHAHELNTEPDTVARIVVHLYRKLRPLPGNGRTETLSELADHLVEFEQNSP